MMMMMMSLGQESWRAKGVFWELMDPSFAEQWIRKLPWEYDLWELSSVDVV